MSEIKNGSLGLDGA